METFLIEVFTKFFATSGSPLLVFLNPILAPAMMVAVLVGIGAVLLGIYDKVSDIYYDSEAFARREERVEQRELQRALDLWQHGYIEYWKDSPFYADRKIRMIVPKDRHEGDAYWKASLLKAHKAHKLGMVANDKLPRGAASRISEIAACN